MKIPTGWQDDGTTLTAPNTHKVIHGFRQHILDDDNWPAALVPLNEEYAIAEGAQQDFALSTVWNASTKAISEVDGVASDAQLKAAQAQILDLQAKLSATHAAFVTARQLLDPFASADSELVDAMKKAGF